MLLHSESDSGCHCRRVSRRHRSYQPTALFQRWRISYADGYYLNLETRNKAKLHGCQCWHAGGAKPSADELGGSLTLKKKSLF